MRNFILALGFLAATSSPAAAQPCNPRDFFNIDFSSLRDYERLVVFSSIDEKTFRDSAAKHQGEMIIPYINVPAKSDFSYTKTVVNQISSVFNAELESQEEQTILRAAITELGVDAYKVCVDRQVLRIEVPTSAIYDEDVFITVRWNGPGNEVGNVEQPLISGGQIVGEAPRTIEDEKAALIRVQRDTTKKLVFGVVVNGMVEQIALPPRPTKILVFKPLTLPENRTVAMNSDNSNGYGPHEKIECFAAPDGWTFITPTVMPIPVSIHGADMGSSFTAHATPDGLRVCARALANSGDKRRGGFAAGQISVIGARLEDIQALNAYMMDPGAAGLLQAQ